MTEVLPSPDSDVYKQLAELYEQVHALAESVKAHKIHYYRPVGRQADFHAANGTDTRLVFGGNRSGKTTVGTMEAIAHAIGYRPWLPVDDPNRIVRLANGNPIPVPNVGRIVAESYEVNIVQTIFPKIEEWCPKEWIVNVHRSQRSVPVRIDIKVPGGISVIHLMSYEQHPRAFEGPSGHWFWNDEPCPQNIWNGLKRGLVDHNGVNWGTMTLLTEPWITEVLAAHADEPGADVRTFSLDVWDNCVERGGHLTRKSILAFLDKLPAAERKTRETGVALHLAGRVFPEWQARPPFWIDPRHIPADWPRVQVIDPHPRKPVATFWAACSPDDIWYIYRSMFDDNLTTIDEVADAMKECEGWRQDKRGTFRRAPGCDRVVLRIIDTSANENEPTSGETIKSAFAKHGGPGNGLICVDAYKRNKSAGLNAIHEALLLRTEWDKPRLIVTNNCHDVKQNFLNYCWPKEHTGRQNEVRDQKQEPIKKYDDMIDGIRYLFQKRLTYAMLVGMARQGGYKMDEDEDDAAAPLRSANHPLPGLHAGYQRGTRPTW